MKDDFIIAAKKDQRQWDIVEGIRKTLGSKNGDYTLLGIECHLCHEKGHISLDCKVYSEIKGNLGQEWLRKMKEQEWENDEGNKRAEARHQDVQIKEERVRHQDSSIESEDNDSQTDIRMFNAIEKNYKKN